MQETSSDMSYNDIFPQGLKGIYLFDMSDDLST